MLKESSIFVHLALRLWFIALPGSMIYAQSINPANKIKFEHLHEGLSESTVTCMVQDRKGFIWCGTRNGLNKYNGVEFTLYEAVDGDSTSLSQNYVTCMYQDSQGNIWVGTLEGGLNLYNSKRDTFSHFRHAPDNPSSLSDNAVYAIYEDVAHHLWIGTANGLNLFSPAEKTFIHYNYEPDKTGSLSNNLVRTIFEDRQSNLWIGTNGGGLDRFEPKTKSFKHHIYNKFDSKTIGNNFIRCSYKDSKGRIWLGTQGGLNLLIETKGSAVFKQVKHTVRAPKNSGNNTVISLSEDRFGRIWIGSQTNGLSIYDEKVNESTVFFPNPLDPGSISSNSIWSILKDNAGTMWLGARNRGLDKWDLAHQQFSRYDIDPSASNTLSNKDVTCFSEDAAENLWIGTDGGGLTYFDRKANKFIHFVNNPVAETSLSSNSVISLLEDKADKLWIGTWGGGLNLYDKKTKIFKRFIHNAADSSSISGNNIFSLLKDRTGKLWIGTYGNGINLFDPKTETFYHPLHDQQEGSLHMLNRVVKIFEDSRNNIWVGTDGGGLALLHWQGKGHFSYTRFKNDPANSESLSSDVVNSIMEDRHHTLWIGTWKGVNRFNYKQQTFKAYRKKDGLPDNVINGILEDDKGFIWFSTNHGLSRFDPEAKTFKNFTAVDGLAAQEFLRGACLKSKAGELFFGSVNGFNAFIPQKIRLTPNASPIYLTEFKINNKVIYPGQTYSPLRNHISETNELVLTYDQNNFGLGFVSLNYSQASKINYSFILEGYDDHWQSAGNRRQVNYSKVPPGTYTFRVRGSLTNDSQDGKETSVNIIINPPWWETWWAYLLYFLIGCGLFYWYRQTLIKQLRLKSDLAIEQLEIAKMQEMEKLKSNYFINISHEFRMPLTLILSPLKDMYAGKFNGIYKDQYQVMIRNAERLLRLINQLLDLSKLNSGYMKIKASNQDLTDFLRPILSSFDSLAKKKSINYSFDFPQVPVNIYFDPDKLEKVITNLLSNAFKFTHSGEIKLSVKNVYEDTPFQAPSAYVEIGVADTGLGISPDHLNFIFDHFYQIVHNTNHADMHGSGIGLSLTKELVELHKGKIRVESIEGKGTTFRVLLPLGKDHLKPGELDDKPDVVEKRTDYRGNQEQGGVVQEDVQDECFLSKESELPLILLVEDNSDMRAYLRGSLATNFQIIEATDGKQGLKKANEKIPDIIISDVLMAKMDGIEMCRLLKTTIATSHIPIILLTAQADSDNRINGLVNGADDYMSKPFDSYELKVRVNNLLKSRETFRQKFATSKNFVLEPNVITITPFDEIFMKKVLESIEKNISDPDYRVEMLGSDIAMSRMPLYRKIKALTGQTAVEFIRTIRLRRAAQLLKQHQLTVSEVTYEVGFNDLQYFRTCFKKQFGVSPSEYAKLDSDTIVTSHADNRCLSDIAD